MLTQSSQGCNLLNCKAGWMRGSLRTISETNFSIHTSKDKGNRLEPQGNFYTSVASTSSFFFFFLKKMGILIVHPNNNFIFVSPTSLCIYKAVDRQTHKVKSNGLCTEWVSVLQTSVLKCRWIFTQWKGSTPTLHTELGWYLRTFGMVYYEDGLGVYILLLLVTY